MEQPESYFGNYRIFILCSYRNPGGVYMVIRKIMRRINEIKNLPISELTDEEIAKAALHRLHAKGVVFAYMDEQDGAAFFSRWKNKNGKLFCDVLMKIWNKTKT